MDAPLELVISVLDGVDAVTSATSTSAPSTPAYGLTPRPNYVPRPIDDGGNTLLHNAARAANLAEVRHLLPHANLSSLQMINDAGFMPLHYIAKHTGKAWHDILVTVLKKGGFTTSKTLDGDNPLHIAARAKNVRGVEALVNYELERGTFKGSLPTNKAGETALDIAAAGTRDSAMSENILTLCKGTSFLNQLFGDVWLWHGTPGCKQSQVAESECPQAFLLWLLSLQRNSEVMWSKEDLNTLWTLDKALKLKELELWMQGSSWLYYTLLWLVPREDFDVQHVYSGGQTILHIALAEELEDIVRMLLKRTDLVEADMEDEKGITPVQHAVEKGLREIEIMLMRRAEVKESVERLYRDRQVYVDAANAILVGSALIASVTFAGWLQPPLGYGNGEGKASMYVAVKGHPGVSSFWVFNSLSFLFSMATMVAGAGAVLPRPDLYIGTAVHVLKTALSMAAFLLLLSAICGIGAFCSAGFAVLPPILMWDMSMILTVGLGGSVNVFMMGWFMRGLLHLRPGDVKRLKEKALRSRLKARAQRSASPHY